MGEWGRFIQGDVDLEKHPDAIALLYDYLHRLQKKTQKKQKRRR